MVSGYVEGDTHPPDHARRGGEECCRQTLLRAARHDARARLAEEPTGASCRAAGDEVYPVGTPREASDPSSYPLRGPVPESNGLCTPSLLRCVAKLWRSEWTVARFVIFAPLTALANCRWNAVGCRWYR